jgi:hypothetical protein
VKIIEETPSNSPVNRQENCRRRDEFSLCGGRNLLWISTWRNEHTLLSQPYTKACAVVSQGSTCRNVISCHATDGYRRCMLRSALRLLPARRSRKSVPQLSKQEKLLYWLFQSRFKSRNKPGLRTSEDRIMSTYSFLYDSPVRAV